MLQSTTRRIATRASCQHLDTLEHVGVPLIGEGYRGPEGHSGYLLKQAWHQFRVAMEAALREHELSAAQYAVLSVLGRDEPLSGADLARACHTSPQAVNGVLGGLQRDGLIERRPHPTHGRILEVVLSDEGRRRLEASNPAVRELEGLLEQGFSGEQVAAVKEWLVTAAQRSAASRGR
jgi:DNA-binding MarR family transcriptional regulator